MNGLHLGNNYRCRYSYLYSSGITAGYLQQEKLTASGDTVAAIHSPAVLAALLAPELFLNQRHFDFSLQNIGLLTAIPCFIIAVKSRSMVVTVVSGMIIYILLNTLL